jgi:uncharacterized protein YdeI (YjbR/CyaY-like superfamily)
MNPKTNFYFDKPQTWQAEINEMRAIVLGCDLTEDLKWGCPCYTWQGNNIVLIHVFKEYCAYLWFKGVLLTDERQLLIQQTEHVQAARQLRFTSINAIRELKPVIEKFVEEAIGLEKSGAKVPMKTTEEYKMPVEFQRYLENDAELQAAFNLLTPGRQRAYLYNFAQPKLEKTRIARIEKYIPKILIGKGYYDE